MSKRNKLVGLVAAALLMAAPAAAQDAPINPHPPAAKQASKPALKASPQEASPQKAEPPALAAQKAAAAKVAALRAQIRSKAAAQKAAALAARKVTAKAKAGQHGPAAAAPAVAQPADGAQPAQANGDELFATDAPAAAQPADQAQAGDSKDSDARWSDEDLTKSLSAYGKWFTDPTYGQVWVPDAGKVGKNFAPYVTGGHWNLTPSAGSSPDDPPHPAWSWASDYPFGKTVFHYGNWAWLTQPAPDGSSATGSSPAGSSATGSSPAGSSRHKGWAWVPGRTFAPAWVVWRLGEPGYDFVGWAPMPPKAPAQAGDASSPSETPPGAVAQPVLPYFFAPTRRLFSRALESNVLTDHALGQEVLNHSKVFDGNKGDGSSAFVPASPTLHDARIRALRKILLSVTPAAATSGGSAQGEQQFATPPPAAAQPSDASQRPTYRCHLLSTRPRAWRCGYE